MIWYSLKVDEIDQRNNGMDANYYLPSISKNHFTRQNTLDPAKTRRDVNLSISFRSSINQFIQILYQNNEYPHFCNSTFLVIAILLVLFLPCSFCSFLLLLQSQSCLLRLRKGRSRQLPQER